MPHPALQLSQHLSSDIFPAAFEWFFSCDVFKRWVEARRPWQLHCVGGPGAGKTTLTALIYHHLKEQPKVRDYPIVAISIDEDIFDYEHGFVEDLLQALYVGLGDTTEHSNDVSEPAYEDYSQKRLSKGTTREGLRFKDRLCLLRKALRLRLEALNNARAFLLLDGMDRCSQTVRFMLEDELAKLSELGLSILTTSRLCVFEQVEVHCDYTYYDFQLDGDTLAPHARDASSIYLECGLCDDFVLCFPCRDSGRLCLRCQDIDNFKETYDHVTVGIAVPESAMKDFIAWNLEREHGDLGLGSSARKPPLSPLGKSLVSRMASKSVQKHANDVLDSAGGHIGMAKARLDLIHNMESLEGIETRRDQLPANIVTMFDSGIKRIEMQPRPQSEIALHAIAAAASDIRGISIPALREKLLKIGAAETRSGEDVLEATKGFLLGTLRDDPQKVAVFHSSFYFYIAERYHQAIHRASLQINRKTPRFENQNVSGTPGKATPSKIARSATMQVIDEGTPKRFISRKNTRAWQ